MERIKGNLALQEESLEEWIGGQPVMMAPPVSNHNRIARNLSGIFVPYLRGKQCEYFGDHEGVFLSDGEEYIPDGMIVCDPEKIKWEGVHGAPDLVIEILSPGTARYDKGRKKDVYEQSGVKEYWIISPTELTIEQYVLQDGKFILRDIYQKYTAHLLRYMTEEERTAVVHKFRCSLYDDLWINVNDVFDRVSIEGERV